MPLNKLIIDNTINNKVLTYSSGVCIADFVKTAMIWDLWITTAKIVDNSVTYAKLNNPLNTTWTYYSSGTGINLYFSQLQFLNTSTSGQVSLYCGWGWRTAQNNGAYYIGWNWGTPYYFYGLNGHATESFGFVGNGDTCLIYNPADTIT